MEEKTSVIRMEFNVIGDMKFYIIIISPLCPTAGQSSYPMDFDFQFRFWTTSSQSHKKASSSAIVDEV